MQEHHLMFKGHMQLNYLVFTHFCAVVITSVILNKQRINCQTIWLAGLRIQSNMLRYFHGDHGGDQNFVLILSRIIKTLFDCFRVPKKAHKRGIAALSSKFYSTNSNQCPHSCYDFWYQKLITFTTRLISELIFFCGLKMHFLFTCKCEKARRQNTFCMM